MPHPLPLPRWGRGDGERSTGRYGIAQRSTVVINQMFCPYLNPRQWERGWGEDKILTAESTENAEGKYLRNNEKDIKI